jgi:hypothetical protein
MRYRCRGELAVHEDGFRVALVGAGYTERCVANQIRVLAHLGYWLQLRGLGAAQLDCTRLRLRPLPTTLPPGPNVHPTTSADDH